MRPAVFPWAEFTSDLPDDVIEDDGGDFLQYGGKSVAGAIAEILAGLGATVTVPEHRAEHGWDFFATYRGRGVWCQVTLIGDYVFVMEETKSIFTRGEPLRPEYLELLSRLAEALDADARFHDVRWLAQDQVADPTEKGYARPVNP